MKTKYQRKPIEGCPGYEIDTEGNVFSYWEQTHKKGVYGVITRMGVVPKLLKLSACRGYLYCGATSKRGIIKLRVHRVVASTFLENNDNKPCVCHRDGDRANNNVDNLYYGTHKENEVDKKRHGTTAKGEKNGNAKLKSKDIVKIRKLFKEGVATKELAKIFGVHYSYIHCIVKKITWKHL